MTRLVVQSRVDADGVLRVSIPVGAAAADREVQVTIEPVGSTAEEDAKYVEWLDQVAGKWHGGFERMPQGEFEARDPL